MQTPTKTDVKRIKSKCLLLLLLLLIVDVVVVVDVVIAVVALVFSITPSFVGVRVIGHFLWLIKGILFLLI